MTSSPGLPTPDGPGSESSSHDARHRLSRRAFIGAAAVATWPLLDSAAVRPAAASTPAGRRASTAAIRPFRVRVPERQLAELRRRLAATRWPSAELVADRSQGVQLATIQALGRFWTNKHDWRRTEAKLNALPQFKTVIDGLDIHFIHVRSRHEGALPLIMTHGWPGSVIEMLEAVGPLTDPTAHGGQAEDAFDLVLPSVPGYGFSAEPTEVGWDTGRTGRAWAELMRRLGYTRYWLTGTGVSAARSYWETARAQALGAGQAPAPVAVPVGFTTFPGEIFQAPRTWVELIYPTLTYFNKVDRGGHFAAWEEPDLFASEVRAAFRSLR